MDIKTINEMIQELENSDTTYANTMDLASLYTVRDNITNVEDEIDDILPTYKFYCAFKRKYQNHEIPIEPVILQLKRVCVEIADLIQTIYSNTDTKEEREILKEMQINLKFF